MKKRVIALLLCLVLILSLFPATALAEEPAADELPVQAEESDIPEAGDPGIPEAEKSDIPETEEPGFPEAGDPSIPETEEADKLADEEKSCVVDEHTDAQDPMRGVKAFSAENSTSAGSDDMPTDEEEPTRGGVQGFTASGNCGFYITRL